MNDDDPDGTEEDRYDPNDTADDPTEDPTPDDSDTMPDTTDPNDAPDRTDATAPNDSPGPNDAPGPGGRTDTRRNGPGAPRGDRRGGPGAGPGPGQPPRNAPRRSGSSLPEDPRTAVYWGGLAVSGVLALVALVSFYTSTLDVIRTWVDPEYRPVFRSAFSLFVLVVAVAGVSLTVRELSE